MSESENKLADLRPRTARELAIWLCSEQKLAKSRAELAHREGDDRGGEFYDGESRAYRETLSRLLRILPKSEGGEG